MSIDIECSWQKKRQAPTGLLQTYEVWYNCAYKIWLDFQFLYHVMLVNIEHKQKMKFQVHTEKDGLPQSSEQLPGCFCKYGSW